MTEFKIQRLKLFLKKHFAISTYIGVAILLAILGKLIVGKLNIFAYCCALITLGMIWVLIFKYEAIRRWLFDTQHPIHRKIAYLIWFICISVASLLVGKIYFFETSQSIAIVFIRIWCALLYLTGVPAIIKHIARLFSYKQQKHFIYLVVLLLAQLIMTFAITYLLILSISYNAFVGLAATNTFELFFEIIYYSAMTLIGGNCPITPYTVLAKFVSGAEALIFAVGISIIIIGYLKDREKANN